MRYAFFEEHRGMIRQNGKTTWKWENCQDLAIAETEEDALEFYTALTNSGLKINIVDPDNDFKISYYPPNGFLDRSKNASLYSLEPE